MKKKIFLVSLISILLIAGLFILTGCNNKDKDTNSSKIENPSGSETNNLESIVGFYTAFETVQYGVKHEGDDVKSENITLLVNDDNTASLSWGESSPKLYKIEKDQFIALDGDEIAKYTYKNGILKVELEGESGFSISFKK